ncbi:MAG: L-threonylcarbamoyladenylate synthase [Gemmatimonadetes bacterium]|nr:L-threonylcarbamoyladenylate synthase [Gemmatimonadota bacterium]
MTAAPAQALGAARRRLEAGELVIHPTESVYGIGGVLEDEALTRLRRLKARPVGGFVVLIPSAAWVKGLLGAEGRALARVFWPGALTLVLDDPGDDFHPGAKAADGTVAVRVPGHPLALGLLAALGRPITSTSANRPGAPPARSAPHARREALDLGSELFALDAGELPGGPPSTLVRLGPSGSEILRAGPPDMLHSIEAAVARTGRIG